MNPVRPSPRRELTVVEVLVVLVVLVVLAGMVIPAAGGAHSKQKAQRIACGYNLKNIGLAMRLFATDHSTSHLLDLVGKPNPTPDRVTDASPLWQQYLPFTNHLSSPRLLWCPADRGRRPATTFFSDPQDPRATVFASSQNLSYFLSESASETQPRTILAGDRNITNSAGPLRPGRHILEARESLGWTGEIHQHAGNLLLGDGSVQPATSRRLNEVFRDASTNAGTNPIVWLVPRILQSRR